jgi:hypothetical protein
MKEEFNLSDKGYYSDEDGVVYPEDDVKEFIRLLKKEIEFGKVPNMDMMISVDETINIIDKLAGEKLI